LFELLQSVVEPFMRCVHPISEQDMLSVVLGVKELDVPASLLARRDG
jgi:hypothetical protein